jgi:hypothetical protein
MSWKDRSEPVEEAAEGDWKSRSELVSDAPKKGFLESAGETAHDALQGAGKGVTLGFGDEIAGFGGAVADAVIGNEGKFWDNYRTHKRDAEEIDEAAAKRSKYAHGGGEFVGAALLPVPGGTAAAGAGLLAKTGRAAAQGLGVGSLYGLGNSKADLTNGEWKQAGLDTAVSGGAGLVAGGVAAPVLHYGGKLASKVFGGAENQALKAAGFAGKDMKKLSPEQATASGNALLEEGLIPFLGSKAAINERVGGRLKEIGTGIGQTLDANPNAFVKRPAIENALEAEASSFEKRPALRDYVEALRGEKQTIAEKMDDLLNARVLNTNKGDYALQAKYDKMTPGLDAKARARRFTADRFRDAEDAAVDAGGQDVNAFRTLKKRYELLTKPDSVSADAAAAEAAKSGMSLSDWVAAGAAQMATGGSPIAGIATAGGKKLLEGRGNSALARMLFKDAAEKGVAEVGQRMSRAPLSKLAEYLTPELPVETDSEPVPENRPEISAADSEALRLIRDRERKKGKR